jgi:hypothetical protein
MHLMWGMMNTLSLLRYMIKINTQIPDNLYLFFHNLDAFLSMKATFINEYLEII